MDSFGDTDPHKMPQHLFWHAKDIHYATAIRGNPEKQNFSVCPRHWYIDADFRCDGCGKQFTWTAEEQKVWFEDFFFWVDSIARHCKKCRTGRRHIKLLRKEYDSIIGTGALTHEQKQRVVEIVTELELAQPGLPKALIETKRIFEKQLKRSQASET